jgi:peptidoglycan/xylan/chitin deacetylase (PgdA/CDA1 family)
VPVPPTIRVALLTLLACASATAAAAAAGSPNPGGAGPGTTPTAPPPPATTPATTPAAPAAPLPLRQATLTQEGTALVLRIATAEPFSPASLRRRQRTLCLRLVYAAGGGFASRDVCVARRGGATTLTLARVLRSGRDGPLHALPARVRRPDGRSLLARIAVGAIPLPFETVRWRVLSRTGDCAIASGSTCFQALPPDGALLALRAPLPTGCTPAGPPYVTNGSRGRHVVALTFDDGPGPDTPAVLTALERAQVPATFFVIGRQVAGHDALLRRMLADGDLIGDHTWSHANVAGAGAFASGQLLATASAIQRASGFRPCLFRAPYGATSGALLALARGLGFTTIQWDVDPRDWALPGTGAIVANVLGHARNGSIVLMHDGGGPRGETLAALPAIVAALRARGFGFVTIGQLTGAALRYD